MRKICVLLAFCVAAISPALVRAQSGAPKVDQGFVDRQFGKEFKLIPEIGVRTGDLDGDGVEDAVIAARCKNPLLDEAEHNYYVLDPYYTFYGYGDPKVTMSFNDDDPIRQGLVVLVIHGSGPEGWRSATPKAKFVIINLPYKTISLHKMRMGKKAVTAIYTEEGNDLNETSAVYFDGKKYKYEPMGSSMQ